MLIVLGSLTDAAAEPVRRAYLNGMIPSQQRATILSFDSLINNAGGIVAQPALGRVADVYSYRTSYLLGGHRLGAGAAVPAPGTGGQRPGRRETTTPTEDPSTDPGPKPSTTQVDA